MDQGQIIGLFGLLGIVIWLLHTISVRQIEILSALNKISSDLRDPIYRDREGLSVLSVLRSIQGELVKARGGSSEEMLDPHEIAELREMSKRWVAGSADE